MKTWINGKLIDEREALIPMFDRAYLYGEGVFETLKSYSGKPAFVDRHYRRLTGNCKKLNIPLPLSEKEFEKALIDSLQANKLGDAAVRITVSTVGASFGLKRPDDASSNITIFCSPLTMDPKLFEAGVKVLPLTSFTNDSKDTAHIKSTSYIIKMMARAEAAKANVFESILKNDKGYWVEGSRTNFFLVLDKVVITSPLSDGLLPGITREVVLEILKEQKISHREDHVTDLMLKNAEEIFLTGSTAEVMPVCEIVGMCTKKVSSNSIAARLGKAYLQLVNAA
ncbi:MAG: hypothetical protein A3F82_10895 [Deltaproteobacteria bacterium RIFCSPLOWO2_12_FULL_44_12]|nr:MAG: hypothetical protein A2712_08900 [Deltaproteobacteria bacterium RIFCSPHIGHO2_01_FULL_43_49]OGQ14545.1 MAG: hypothetical protein A3D22_08100 [Deltaproteobacteria bacterium RIFCSPHIGHO2_02_FULL_44_53]OGQ27931.1 MAG: hypothetical protein A3D98_06810 [Deltaproteobacteria bacterium RIFCSPHIGHO2_12_FULL_44_21]OGQ31143.1 MAG: hypothetical protein A2979_06860 [Deltaproteobacteria bacterium RIFCSPLOWO2_01_FULL_45_74]OGQ43135.1 MAG: hypothetical protein A3I70_00520 [Deltaproteobacteria bacterium 